MTTTAVKPRPFPAFRIARGDVVRHLNRKVTVVGTEQVVFIPRNRNAGPSQSGVKLTLRTASGSFHRVSLRNSDTIPAYR